MPSLRVAAERDRLQTARDCECLVARSPFAIEVRVLPGADLGFDDAETAAFLLVEVVYRLILRREHRD